MRRGCQDDHRTPAYPARAITDNLAPRAGRSYLCPTWGSNQGPVVQAPSVMTTEPLGRPDPSEVRRSSQALRPSVTTPASPTPALVWV